LRIKGYRIIDVVAKRPDMTIAIAIQKSLDRKVFLKILPADLSSHQDILDQFEQEAKALARLDNPHIITIYEFGRAGANPFIVLEYFPSRHLGQVLQDKGPLSTSELVSIMTQSLDGLNHSQKAGVLHRDLKPENVLLHANGTIKLTDFGLSTLIGVQKQGQTIAGTPGYFSPELALGEPASESSDIFALGMVFYELATGTNPLKSSDLSEALNLAVSYVPKPVSQQNPDLPTELAAIIDRMIAKSLDERYRHCDQILEDLDEINIKDSPTPINLEPEPAPVKSRGFPVIRVVALLLVVLLASFFVPRLKKAFLNSNVSSQPDPLPSATVEDSQETNPSFTEPQGDISPPSFTHVPETSLSPSVIDSSINPILNVAFKPGESKVIESKPRSLTIIVYPWAHVYLDSLLLGTTPLDAPIQVEPGEHRLQFKNPLFPDYYTTLSVTEPNDTLVFRCTDVFGFVRLTVNPWANVYIDGKYIDSTPLNRILPLEAVEHHVILKNPDFPIWQKFIQLTAGDTVNLKVQLIG